MTDRVADNDTLGSLEAALRDAVAQKVSAELAEMEARNKVTSALNKVNDIQKRIDAKLKSMRYEKEMHGTDWARSKSYVGEPK